MTARRAHIVFVSRAFPLCDAFRSSFRTFLGSFTPRSDADLGAIFIIPGSDFALTGWAPKFITQIVDLVLRAPHGNQSSVDTNRVL
jgi:hypothetical protein